MIKTYYARDGFYGLLGAIDGTMFPLDRAPNLDRNAFATRKSNFALGGTGIVDFRRVFTFFVSGYSGAQHDSASYKGTDLYLSRDTYFANGEYIIGDAAYGLSPILITGFKGKATKDQTRFNRKLNHHRVRVEHAFGLLKGRFRSLRGLRIDIDSRDKIHDATMHVSACVVLHNILLTSRIANPYLMDVERWEKEQRAYERAQQRREPRQAVVEEEAGDSSEEDDDGHGDILFTNTQMKQMRLQAVNKRQTLMAAVLYRRVTE
jgi:hypothetical protein